LVQFLMIADTQGMLVGSLAAAPFAFIGLSRETVSYLLAFCWIVFGSLQWWLVGSYAWRRWQLRYRGSASHGAA
jgi:hypothetical protein